METSISFIDERGLLGGGGELLDVLRHLLDRVGHLLDRGRRLLHARGERVDVLRHLVVGRGHLEDRRGGLLGALGQHLDVVRDALQRADISLIDVAVSATAPTRSRCPPPPAAPVRAIRSMTWRDAVRDALGRATACRRGSRRCGSATRRACPSSSSRGLRRARGQVVLRDPTGDHAHLGERRRTSRRRKAYTSSASRSAARAEQQRKMTSCTPAICALQLPPGPRQQHPADVRSACAVRARDGAVTGRVNAHGPRRSGTPARSRSRVARRSRPPPCSRWSRASRFAPRDRPVGPQHHHVRDAVVPAALEAVALAAVVPLGQRRRPPPRRRTRGRTTRPPVLHRVLERRAGPSRFTTKPVSPGDERRATARREERALQAEWRHRLEHAERDRDWGTLRRCFRARRASAMLRGLPRGGRGCSVGLRSGGRGSTSAWRAGTHPALTD